jgi:anti-sigma factor RsiW
MDCEVVHARVDESPPDPEVLEHLGRCSACQAEMQFNGRVAAAVGTMPRVPAPDGLLEKVMAAVRGQAESLPVRRAPVLLLRPWELAWIGVACLALLGLLSRLLPGWPHGWSAPGAAAGLSGWMRRLSNAAWDEGGPFRRLWESGAGRLAMVAGGDGGVWVWACGAAGFALAFYLLLSWNRSSGGVGTMEDAHA